MSSRRERGFTMIEMAIVLAIVVIIGGITFISLQPVLRGARVDNAYNTTLTQLRQARQRSISERKRYIVHFTSPQTIELWRWDFAVPVSPTAVLVSTIKLPNDIQFSAESGIPTGGGKTPDSFGSGGAAIDFDQGVGSGTTNEVMFMPDGSAQDRSGNLNSGVVYLARPGDLYSSRAVTVFGSTGRIRGWRLIKNGTKQWIQQ